jgi:hypothetical protein
VGSIPAASFHAGSSGVGGWIDNGQVAERPMAPDCKSGEVTSSQVRILPCPYAKTCMNMQRGQKRFLYAGVAQLAEHRLSKPNVTGSIPVTRFAS